MNKDRLLITVVLAGLIGFLYPLYDFLGHIDNWEVIDQPHGISQLIWCVICGLAAIGASLGINIKNLLFNNINSIDKVSDSKRNELAQN